MKGKISSFRRARHHQSDNQMIVIVDDVKDKEGASKLVEKDVVWQSPAKKDIKGRVTSAHGNKGAVRVAFETGMPGQSIGTEVSIQ